MKIIKTKSEVGTIDIRLEENEDKHLDIIFGGTGDVYWILDDWNLEYLEEDPMYGTFVISKEDYGIYMIFDELYNDLIDGRIYHPEKLPDYYLIFDPKAQEKEIQRTNESNKEIKQSSRYKKLVNNGVITWYSDEEYETITEIVKISKKEDAYLLEFIRQSKKDEFGNKRMKGYYSIRFRLSGSTYTPCDIVFWRHFNNLQEYEPDKEFEEIKTDLDTNTPNLSLVESFLKENIKTKNKKS